MSQSRSSSRPSWRQGARPTIGSAAPLKKRRRLASFSLLLLLLVAVGLGYWWFTQRFVHTTVVVLTSSSITNTIDQEEKYSLPPLRFVSETVEPLRAYATKHLIVRTELNDFSPNNIEKELDDATIRLVPSQDTLLLWIRAKGISIEKTPILAKRDFTLPKTESEWKETPGGLPVAKLLSLISKKWQGKTVLLLDWGNQLSDARVGFLANSFFADLDRTLRESASDQIWILSSHQSGQVSLDASDVKKTLFGRACAEALTGQFRFPDDAKKPIMKSPHLGLNDLANYVYRRVRADSGGTQLPWLLRGGVGMVDSLDDVWNDAKYVEILRRGFNGRPLDWPSLPIVPETGSDEKSKSGGSGSAAQNPESSLAGLDPSIRDAWNQLESQWMTPLPGSSPSDPWLLSAIAPVTFKQLASALLDSEFRFEAGKDYRHDKAEVDSWIRGMNQAADGIRNKFSIRKAQWRIDATPTPEQKQWQNALASLAAYRLVALDYREYAGLEESISQIDPAQSEKLGEILRETAEAMTAWQENWNRIGSENVTWDLNVDWQSTQFRLEQVRKKLLAAQQEFVTSLKNTDNVRNRMYLTQILLQFRLTPDLRDQLRALEKSAARLPRDDWNRKLEKGQLQVKPTGVWSRFQNRLPLATPLTAGSDPLSVLQQHWSAEGKITEQDSNANPTIDERIWTWIDGRYLNRKQLGNWSAESQLPNPPPPPLAPSNWNIAWFDVSNPEKAIQSRVSVGRTLSSGRFLLRLSKQGEPILPAQVKLELNGLEAKIGSGEWDVRKSIPIRMEHAAWIQKSNSREIPIEVRPADRRPNSPSQGTARVDLVADGNSATATTTSASSSLPLELLFPVARPLQLVVNEQVRRNKQLVWVKAGSKTIPLEKSFAEVVTLSPFPGHASKIQFQVANRDNSEIEADLEVYVLSQRDTAKGKLIGLENELLVTANDLTTKKLLNKASLKLGANQQQVVSFAAPTKPPEGAPTDAKPPAATPTSPAATVDISWGLLVRLSEKLGQPQDVYLQFEPRPASDLVKIIPDSKPDGSILVTAQLQDGDIDLPIDIEKKKISVRWDIANWLDDSDIGKASLALDEKLTSSGMSLRPSRSILTNREILIDVDGVPRALAVDFNQRTNTAWPAERRARFALEYVSVPGGMTYRNDLSAADPEKKMAPFIKGTKALFRRAEKTIQLGLKLDPVASEGDAAQTILLIDGVVERRFARERDFLALLDTTAIVDELSYATEISDWRLDIDFGNAINKEVLLEVQSGSTRQPIGTIVLDNKPPERRASQIVSPVVQEGKGNGILLQWVDASGIATCDLFVTQANGERPGSKIKTLTSQDFTATNGVWNANSAARTFPLPADKFKPGKYELYAKAKDLLDNESDLIGPLTFEIKSLIESKPAYEGPLKGEVLMGNGTRPRNEVKIVLEEGEKKTTLTSGDGKFQFDKLKAGTYKIKASSRLANDDYVAEETVTLEDEPNWKPIRKLTLAKKENK